MTQDDRDHSPPTTDSFAGLPSGEFDYDMYRAGKKRRRLRDRKAWTRLVTVQVFRQMGFENVILQILFVGLNYLDHSYRINLDFLT